MIALAMAAVFFCLWVPFYFLCDQPDTLFTNKLHIALYSSLFAIGGTIFTYILLAMFLSPN